MTHTRKFFALLALVGACEFSTTTNLSGAGSVERFDGVVSPKGEGEEARDTLAELRPDEQSVRPPLDMHRQAKWPAGSRSGSAGRKRGTLPDGAQEILTKVATLKAQLLERQLNWEKDIAPFLQDIYGEQTVNAIATTLYEYIQQLNPHLQIHYDTAANTKLLHVLTLANNLHFTAREFKELLRHFFPEDEGQA